MVKLVKYFLITVKSFIKRCKTFFLLFLELDKTFYKNMLCSPSPYLVAKSLIQWAIGVDGLVVEVVFLMTDASFLITRDIIPTTRAAFPMIEAAFRWSVLTVQSPKSLFWCTRQSLYSNNWCQQFDHWRDEVIKGPVLTINIVVPIAILKVQSPEFRHQRLCHRFCGLFKKIYMSHSNTWKYFTKNVFYM